MRELKLFLARMVLFFCVSFGFFTGGYYLWEFSLRWFCITAGAVFVTALLLSIFHAVEKSLSKV